MWSWPCKNIAAMKIDRTNVSADRNRAMTILWARLILGDLRKFFSSLWSSGVFTPPGSKRATYDALGHFAGELARWSPAAHRNPLR
jgi:hypothetical protein